MSILDVYRDEVRARVDQAVRANGYSGWSEDWHTAGPSGDHGMISVQRNRLSNHHVAFRVHLAVTPGPWWDYVGSSMPPRTTNGLWRQVLTPTTDHVEHRGERWWLISDHDSAHRCGLDVLDGLTGYGFNQIERLLQRPALLDTIQRGNLGRRHPYPRTLQMELLLLHADEGDMEGFTRAADFLHAALPPCQDLITWAEQRLQSRTSR